MLEPICYIFFFNISVKQHDANSFNNIEFQLHLTSWKFRSFNQLGKPSWCNLRRPSTSRASREWRWRAPSQSSQFPSRRWPVTAEKSRLCRGRCEASVFKKCDWNGLLKLEWIWILIFWVIPVTGATRDLHQQLYIYHWPTGIPWHWMMPVPVRSLASLKEPGSFVATNSVLSLKGLKEGAWRNHESRTRDRMPPIVSQCALPVSTNFEGDIGMGWSRSYFIWISF